MAGRNGRKTEIGGQFAWRLVEMLESPAYRVLSLAAHRVLARLEIEKAHHGGQDNGKLPVTFDQFQEYGVHRNSVAPALRELEALGFIETTEKGRAGNAEWRRPSLYRLTYQHTNLNATDEWRKIQTLEEAEDILKRTKKEKTQYRKSYQDSVRKPYRPRPFHSTETDTTSHSTETDTTSISREGSATLQHVAIATAAPPTKGQARAVALNVGATVIPLGLVSRKAVNDSAEKQVVDALGGWDGAVEIEAVIFQQLVNQQADTPMSPEQIRLAASSTSATRGVA